MTKPLNLLRKVNQVLNKLLRPKLLLIASFIALNSCGTISVYDREVCADLGEVGAYCRHTLVDKKRDISKDKWDEVRVGMLCMNSQAYTDAETAIDQFCTAYGVCDYKTREELRQSFARVGRVARKAKAAKDKRKISPLEAEIL